MRLDLHAGPLVPRVIDRDGTTAEVALVSGGALLLGGDRVDLEIEVGDGCSLDLVDIGGTVAYDGEGRPSWWNARITLGRDAHLAWNSLPFVVSTGANVRRLTQVTLADEATLLLRETLVLGRSREEGGRLETTTTVTGRESPVLVESLFLDGRYGVPGVADGHRVIDSLLLAGRRAPSVSDGKANGSSGDRAPGEALFLPLEQPGTLARWLGRETHRSPVAAIWDAWRTPPSADQGTRVDEAVSSGRCE
ncbi:urease accessory protein UreD [Frondihabitans sp. PAMC 28766]|uniref:urease accessory protein UreD n=1 Tax=Frondihabitans sp. PAMC 28766 TaxID=1795630 RepID=UPI0012FF964A|nr:urease accessory protein UreD [Frondihabitans sp. PAMC 28766]